MMLHVIQLPCHNVYIIDFLYFMIAIDLFTHMLIPHGNGHFCTEADTSEQLLTY